MMCVCVCACACVCLCMHVCVCLMCVCLAFRVMVNGMIKVRVWGALLAPHEFFNSKYLFLFN